MITSLKTTQTITYYSIPSDSRPTVLLLFKNFAILALTYITNQAAMNILRQLTERLEIQFPALVDLYGNYYTDDIQGRISVLFYTLNINKSICMEICGYSDMQFTTGGIKITYSKESDADQTEFMDLYEAITFVEKMYDYICENFDNDYILFKLL